MAAKPNSTTYRNTKKVIERNNYIYDEMMEKLDVFLLGDRITKGEYDELVEIMENQKPKVEHM